MELFMLQSLSELFGATTLCFTLSHQYQALSFFRSQSLSHQPASMQPHAPLKKGVDTEAASQKRFEAATSIRKEKRERMLQAKRFRRDAPDFGMESEDAPPLAAAATSSSSPPVHDAAAFPHIVVEIDTAALGAAASALASAEAGQMSYAQRVAHLKTIRNILSKGGAVAIDPVIASGAVPIAIARIF